MYSRENCGQASFVRGIRSERARGFWIVAVCGCIVGSAKNHSSPREDSLLRVSLAVRFQNSVRRELFQKRFTALRVHDTRLFLGAVFQGVPSSRTCDGGVGPRRGWHVLPGPTLERQVRAALRLLLLLHTLLCTGPRVRAMLETLAGRHHVAHTDHRVMGHGRSGVMRAVRARRRRHVRGWTRQGRAWSTAATLVSAAPAASAWLPVLHQHRHGHPSRRTCALEQPGPPDPAVCKLNLRAANRGELRGTTSSWLGFCVPSKHVGFVGTVPATVDQTSSQGSVCQTSSTSSYAASPSFHRAPAEGFGASSGTPRHAKQKLKQAGRVPAGTTTQLYQHSVHDIPLRSPQQRRDALIIRSRPPENNACPPAGLWLPWISLGGEQAWKMHGDDIGRGKSPPPESEKNALRGTYVRSVASNGIFPFGKSCEPVAEQDEQFQNKHKYCRCDCSNPSVGCRGREHLYDPTIRRTRSKYENERGDVHRSDSIRVADTNLRARCGREHKCRHAVHFTLTK